MATVLASTASQLPVTYHNALANRYSPAKLAELAAADVKPHFFYGSLMLPSIIAHVIGNQRLAPQLASRMTPATLYDHERCAVYYADYPAVIPVTANKSSTLVPKVEGMLVFALTAEQRYALHCYESGLYNLTSVEVEVEVVESLEAEGAPVEKRMMVKVAAEVYIWGGRRDELYDVSQREWSIEGFLSSNFAKRMLLVEFDEELRRG